MTSTRSGCPGSKVTSSKDGDLPWWFQANELLPRSVVLIAPTSRSARHASFRPGIGMLGEKTTVLVEQVGSVAAGRMGDLVGRVTPEEQ